MNHTNMNLNLNGPTPSDDYLNHEDGNHFFGNKCLPMKTLDNTDYMIVSEEIIDILDLTNDEVEQILDDNMISSHDFDTLNSPRLTQSQTQSQSQSQTHQPPTYSSRVPRINLATNLTKTSSPIDMAGAQCEGKTIDMRPLETPTINLDTTVTETECQTGDTAKVATTLTVSASASEPVIATKKKCGRTKGARQISMHQLFYSFLTQIYTLNFVRVFLRFSLRIFCVPKFIFVPRPLNF